MESLYINHLTEFVSVNNTPEQKAQIPGHSVSRSEIVFFQDRRPKSWLVPADPGRVAGLLVTHMLMMEDEAQGSYRHLGVSDIRKQDACLSALSPSGLSGQTGAPFSFHCISHAGPGHCT